MCMNDLHVFIGNLWHWAYMYDVIVKLWWNVHYEALGMNFREHDIYINDTFLVNCKPVEPCINMYDEFLVKLSKRVFICTLIFFCKLEICRTMYYHVRSTFQVNCKLVESCIYMHDNFLVNLSHRVFTCICTIQFFVNCKPVEPRIYMYDTFLVNC